MPQLTINKAPIAVYQMGKVGSETIINSLNNLDLIYPVYHIHILAHHHLNTVLPRYQKQNLPLTLQLKHSQTLRTYLDRNSTNPLNVITAVREPISQFISAFFQNIKTLHPDFIEQDGTWNEKKIYTYLSQKINNYNAKTAWNCNWFDNDFKSALNIDIYQHKFNRQLGYTEFTEGRIKVLVLQLEKSHNWQKHISDFLDSPEPIKITKSNLGSTKDYGVIYNSMLNKLKVQRQTLEKIYQSKYCQHFYSARDLEIFIERWSDTN